MVRWQQQACKRHQGGLGKQEGHSPGHLFRNANLQRWRLQGLVMALRSPGTCTVCLGRDRVITEVSSWDSGSRRPDTLSRRSMSPRGAVTNQVSSCKNSTFKDCASKGGLRQQQGRLLARVVCVHQLGASATMRLLSTMLAFAI